MTKKIIIEQVFKIFGAACPSALLLAQQGLSKDEIFKQTGNSMAVSNVSLEIEEGEIFVIMGLSGSGKSTLVRLLNRLIEPTAGRILINGENIQQLTSAQLRQLRRKEVSMVFQSFALMPHLNVRDNTALGLELAGMPKSQRLAQANLALAQVGLTQWGDSYPDALSGGMQQRVGLARALASDPSVLLMDEAFSALDPIIRAEMQAELLNLQQIQPRTIVFISHDLDEAMRLGNHIAIMKDGALVQVGTPEEILRQPANAYVRNFVRGVDAAAVFKAGDIARTTQVVVAEYAGKGARAALQKLQDQDRDYAYVVSPTHQFLGMVSADSLRAALKNHDGPLGLSHAYLPEVVPIDAGFLVSDLYGQVAQAAYPLPVISEGGQFKGAISKNTLLKFLDTGV